MDVKRRYQFLPPRHIVGDYRKPIIGYHALKAFCGMIRQ